MKLLEDFLRIGLSILILAAGIGVYVTLIYLPSHQEKKEVAAKKTLVETTRVASRESGLVIPVDGVVVPYREIQIAAEVSGVIEAKSENCRAGKYVRKDEVLFRIERDYYQKELEILEKEYEQAERTIAELDIEKKNLTKLIANAEAQEKIEEDQENRYRRIRENSTRLLTDREYDLQHLALLGVQNQLIELRNQQTLLETKRLRLERAKEQTQLRIDRAQLDLERTEVKAPIGGMIINDLVEQDSYVAKGTVVATIEDVSKVEVRCKLRMDQMYWIWRQPTQATDPSDYYRIPKTPVRVIYNLGGRELVWKGVLTRYDGIGVDEATRTVPCRVVIDNPRSQLSGGTGASRIWSGPPALVRGMYVTVEVETKPADVLLQIPELALKPNQTVWVVRDGKLTICEINVVEVLSGNVVFTQNGEKKDAVLPGDRVVVTPLPGVYDGMPVSEESDKTAKSGKAAKPDPKGKPKTPNPKAPIPQSTVKKGGGR